MLETNEQTRKTNKNSQTQTTSMVVSRPKGEGVVKGKEAQIYGDGRRRDFGW